MRDVAELIIEAPSIDEAMGVVDRADCKELRNALVRMAGERGNEDLCRLVKRELRQRAGN